MRRANERSSKRMADGKRAAVRAVIKVRDSGGPLLSDSRTHSNLSDRWKEREVGVEGRWRDRQTEGEIIGVCDRADRNTKKK